MCIAFCLCPIYSVASWNLLINVMSWLPPHSPHAVLMHASRIFYVFTILLTGLSPGPFPGFNTSACNKVGNGPGDKATLFMLLLSTDTRGMLFSIQH